MGFEATVRPSDDGIATIELHGDLNSQAEEVLDAAYTRAEPDGTTAVLLNFSGVDYMNSTGIALVVSLLARSRQTGGEIRACGLSEHYREIFEITRLTDLIRIFPDEAAALAGAPAQ